MHAQRIRFLTLLLALACVAGCSPREVAEASNRSTPGESERGPRRSAVAPDRSAERDRRNLFVNGDFERGRDPWFDLASTSKDYWHGFQIATDVVLHGKASAHLSLDARAKREPVSIYGVVQEVTVPERRDPATGEMIRELPETISGWYRVENWTRRVPKQYLQFVVILWGSDLKPDFPNHQIRYLLAGVKSPPFQLSNARFVHLGGAEPETGRWIRFERNLRQDFTELWGILPRRYVNIRCLFEVRFDDRQDTLPGHLADVYYDDLYIGPTLPAGR